jgi:predicted ATPase
MSHGESFLEVLGDRFTGPGLYVLDEPESALSFSGCLALVGLLNRIAKDGRRQALVATHSPIIAATPAARILEIGDWGIRESTWADLELVQNWKDFLDDPNLYLRYVIE